MSDQLKRFERYNNCMDLEPVRRWLEIGLANKSDKTCATYSDGVLALAGYAVANGLDFAALTSDDIVAFRSSLTANGISPSTVGAYLAGIRSYYRFVAADGLGENIAAGIKSPKKLRGFRKDTLTADEVWEMLGHIDRSTLHGMRDYAMLNLMVRCGLRDVEITRAQVGDITFPAEKVSALIVWGKGRAERDDFVILEENTLSPISDYLAARGRPADDEPLFASLSPRNAGAPLTTRSISRIVKNRMRDVGIDSERYTAHSLRHTAVTFALMGGASVQQAQAMARHADISTTMIYAHNVDRLRNPGETAASDFLDNARRD